MCQKGSSPVGDHVLVPAGPLNGTESVHIWNATAGAPHHLHRPCVQLPGRIEPKEQLHVSDLGVEGRPASPPAPQGLVLQVVEPLQESLGGVKISVR